MLISYLDSVICEKLTNQHFDLEKKPIFEPKLTI